MDRLPFFLGENQYGSTDEAWRRYFIQFAPAAAVRRARRVPALGRDEC